MAAPTRPMPTWHQASLTGLKSQGAEGESEANSADTEWRGYRGSNWSG